MSWFKLDHSGCIFSPTPKPGEFFPQFMELSSWTKLYMKRICFKAAPKIKKLDASWVKTAWAWVEKRDHTEKGIPRGCICGSYRMWVWWVRLKHFLSFCRVDRKDNMQRRQTYKRSKKRECNVSQGQICFEHNSFLNFLFFWWKKTGSIVQST